MLPLEVAQREDRSIKEQKSRVLMIRTQLVEFCHQRQRLLRIETWTPKTEGNGKKLQQRYRIPILEGLMKKLEE